MIQDGGFYYVIGYGQNIDIPTIDVISREISFIGNLVGTYVDLQELMTLDRTGPGHPAHLHAIHSTPSTTRWPTSIKAGCRAAGILVPAGASSSGHADGAGPSCGVSNSPPSITSMR